MVASTKKDTTHAFGGLKVLSSQFGFYNGNWCKAQTRMLETDNCISHDVVFVRSLLELNDLLSAFKFH